MYRGRLAPSPTGFLHIGHARTFLEAAERCRVRQGRLLLRNDDLDVARCRPEFVSAFIEDFAWLGIEWEGPMISQSQRLPRYENALAELHRKGLIYPCRRSRRDVLEATSAPHEGGSGSPLDEPVYPPEFRPPLDQPLPALGEKVEENWRFRVQDGERLQFMDLHFGEQYATAGYDFGDFLVWRKDGFPSYQLASVVDDIDYGITEVVRGADLIRSTFRQLLLFRAFGVRPPEFYHCPLVTDTQGVRLAKRHDALSVRALRLAGKSPQDVLALSGGALP